MDEFAGLDKGWNDPDMLMVGMTNMTTQMSQTHFTMWCMMNSPLMLGLDLRRITKGDELYKIIANADLIALNQDPLGLQAKRIYTTATKADKDEPVSSPDTAYITDCDRVDILAKALTDGSLALSFINLSKEKKCGRFSVDLKLIQKYLSDKLPSSFYESKHFNFKNLWTGERGSFASDVFSVSEIEGCGNITLKITAAEK